MWRGLEPDEIRAGRKYYRHFARLLELERAAAYYALYLIYQANVKSAGDPRDLKSVHWRSRAYETLNNATVEFDTDGRVISLEEKPAEPTSSTASSGSASASACGVG